MYDSITDYKHNPVDHTVDHPVEHTFIFKLIYYFTGNYKTFWIKSTNELLKTLSESKTIKKLH